MVLWEQNAAGSSPVTPTKKALGNQSQSLFFVSSDANFEGRPFAVAPQTIENDDLSQFFLRRRLLLFYHLFQST